MPHALHTTHNTCTHTHTCTQHVHTYTYVYTHAHAHNMYTHTQYTHTYTCTHMHAPTRIPPRRGPGSVDAAPATMRQARASAARPPSLSLRSRGSDPKHSHACYNAQTCTHAHNMHTYTHAHTLTRAHACMWCTHLMKIVRSKCRVLHRVNLASTLSWQF